MKLSVILVNYRSAAYIIDCIRSATAFESVSSFEWIVVDNASGDDSREKILQQFSFVQWVDMGYNAGFARANNAGIRQATGDVLLLLNPDTLILNDAIQQCYLSFVQSSYAACGVQLLYENGASQISGSYFMKGGINHLLSIPYWGRFLRWLAFQMHTRKPGVEQVADEVKVDWISGAFLMVKKKAIAVAGLMDEDFFLYGEEVEWCRLLKKEVSLLFYCNISIVHLMGESIKDATQTKDKTYDNLFDKKGLQLIVSNHVRIRKQYGIGWFVFQLLNYTWGVLVFAICGTIWPLIRGKSPVGEWKKIGGLTKNVAVVWSLLPVIVRNKPHFYKML